MNNFLIWPVGGLLVGGIHHTGTMNVNKKNIRTIIQMLSWVFLDTMLLQNLQTLQRCYLHVKLVYIDAKWLPSCQSCIVSLFESMSGSLRCLAVHWEMFSSISLSSEACFWVKWSPKHTVLEINGTACSCAYWIKKLQIAPSHPNKLKAFQTIPPQPNSW